MENILWVYTIKFSILVKEKNENLNHEDWVDLIFEVD